MLARLWWKEFRVFGPVWLALCLVAALLQWLFLSVNGEDARSGSLTVSALCWAVLYAFAVGRRPSRASGSRTRWGSSTPCRSAARRSGSAR